MIRSGYRYWTSMGTRWMDQDAFGHINNVQYYSFIDTSVCTFLSEKKVISFGEEAKEALRPQPFVVHSSCNYYKPIVFPSKLEIGISVVKLGTSSCTYRIGIFDGSAESASAVGTFVHSWTDPTTSRPTPMPGDVRTAYTSILNESCSDK